MKILDKILYLYNFIITSMFLFVNIFLSKIDKFYKNIKRKKLNPSAFLFFNHTYISSASVLRFFQMPDKKYISPGIAKP